MWLAQTNETRHGASSFVHHKDLPVAHLGNSEVQLLAGSIGDLVSPVATDWPLIGAEVRVHGPTALPVAPSFEHAVVPIDRTMKVNEAIVEPGSLAIVPPGVEELSLESADRRGRALLIGGVPFPDRLQMWWNFVARTREELTDAWRDWRDHNDDRFGPVPSSLARIDAPTPIWIRED